MRDIDWNRMYWLAMVRSIKKEKVKRVISIEFFFWE